MPLLDLPDPRVAPHFINDLDVRLVRDPVEGQTSRSLWKTISIFGYASPVAKQIIIVPRDFVTDFASVPRLPLVWEKFGGKFHRSALVHDYLYQSGVLPRRTADQVLREAAMTEGLCKEDADAVYAAVRLAGGPNYHSPN